MIRALLIDLFDTLVYFEEKPYLAWRHEMASRLGVPPEKFMKEWWRHTEDRFLGKIKDIPQMLDIIASHFNVELSDTDREDLSKRELQALLSVSHLYPGTLQALRDMKKEGLLLALVSNASTNAIHILESLKISRCFNVKVLSCDVGLAKPDVKIYQIAMSKLNVIPQECLFIGDGACRELDGARLAGIRTVKISQKPQSELFGKSDHYDFEISSLKEVLAIAKKL